MADLTCRGQARSGKSCHGRENRPEHKDPRDAAVSPPKAERLRATRAYNDSDLPTSDLSTPGSWTTQHSSRLDLGFEIAATGPGNEQRRSDSILAMHR